MDTIELRERLKTLNKQVNEMIKSFINETGELDLGVSVTRLGGEDTIEGRPEFQHLEINVIL